MATTRRLTGGVGFIVELSGVEGTIAEIKAFDKKLYKKLDQQLRRTAQQVQKDAAAAAPEVTGRMKAGYKTKKLTGRYGRYTIGYKVVNMTVEGAILEYAGYKSSGRTKQGVSLIATLRQRYGQPGSTGRFAWAAYDKRAPELEAKYTAYVKAAEAEMQARMNAIT